VAALAAMMSGCMTTGEHEAGDSAIRHVVLLAFKADITPEQRAIVEAASSALVHDTGLIRRYEWGTDLNAGQRSQGYTHCIVMKFDNADDLKAYIVHPAHVAFKEKALPFIEKILVIDYQPQPEPQAP